MAGEPHWWRTHLVHGTVGRSARSPEPVWHRGVSVRSRAYRAEPLAKPSPTRRTTADSPPTSSTLCIRCPAWTPLVRTPTISIQRRTEPRGRLVSPTRLHRLGWVSRFSRSRWRFVRKSELARFSALGSGAGTGCYQVQWPYRACSRAGRRHRARRSSTPEAGARTAWLALGAQRGHVTALAARRDHRGTPRRSPRRWRSSPRRSPRRCPSGRI
jgi:hypothetical protein